MSGVPDRQGWRPAGRPASAVPPLSLPAVADLRDRLATRVAAELARSRALDADFERRGLRRADDPAVRRLRRELPRALGGRRVPGPAALVEGQRLACELTAGHLRDAGLWGPSSAEVLTDLWRSA